MRTRLLAVVMLASLIILTALVTAFNVALRTTLNNDATEVARARAGAVLATVTITGGQVILGETPDDRATDARVWVFVGAGVVEAPPTSPEGLDAAAAKVGANAPAERTTRGERLVSVPIARDGHTFGAVVAAVTLAPYDATARTVLGQSVLLAVVLLAVIFTIGAWTLRRALRAVHQMTRLASEWSEHDPERRFAQGPPRDELTELAATLDGLLGRLSSSLRREERFSSELAHELRTPLSRITAECELALRDRADAAAGANALQAIGRSAHEMRRTIDVLVLAARHGAGHLRGVAELDAVIAALVDRASKAADDRGIALVVPGETRCRVAIDTDLAERIIEPIIENAVRYATTRVVIEVAIAASSVSVSVEDDGAGVAPADRVRIFEPGQRAAGARGDGAGLGLALARRLAVEASSAVELAESATGSRFLVRLPTIP